MLKTVSTKSVPTADVKCRVLKDNAQVLEAVDSRHKVLPGCDQDQPSVVVACIIGCGGLDGENTEGFIRKGIGQPTNFDGDMVDLSNLNRQMCTQS